MSDPPRLRDLPGGDDFARSLLRDAAPTRPFTPADAARLTAAVSHAGAATSGTWLSASALPKALAAVALVAAGAGAWRATRSAPPAAPVTVTRASTATPVVARPHTSSPAVAAPSAVAARVVAPVAVTPTAPARVALAPTPAVPVVAPAAPVAVAAPRVLLAPARPAVAAAAPSHAAPPRPSVALAASDAPPPTLGDEVLAVTQARAALRNNPARAVEILARAERAVTRPQLLDERDLVHVEALARLGRWAEARDRALALEARAPRSPQSARARALLRGAP